MMISDDLFRTNLDEDQMWDNLQKKITIPKYAIGKFFNHGIGRVNLLHQLIALYRNYI